MLPGSGGCAGDFGSCPGKSVAGQFSLMVLVKPAVTSKGSKLSMPETLPNFNCLPFLTGGLNMRKIHLFNRNDFQLFISFKIGCVLEPSSAFN